MKGGAMKMSNCQFPMRNKKGGVFMKIQVASLLLVILLIGGCGTAANEVAKLSPPDREVVVLTATNIPSNNLITVQSQASPLHDLIVGTAGAVESGAEVRAYDCYPGGHLLYSTTAVANGSFTMDIGDDDPATGLMYVTALKSGKVESNFICLNN